MGLDAEDVAAERVAFDGEAADEFGGLLGVEGGQLVSGVLFEEVGQQGIGDGGEGAEGFKVAGAAAIAVGDDAFDAGDALVGDEDVAEFAPEAEAAFDDTAVDDDAAAEAGADDGRDGGFFGAGAEEGEVAPECAGVAVVEVDDGFAEALFEVEADVEAGPIGMDEIGGTAGAEQARGAGRAWGVEADGGDVVGGDAGCVEGDLEAVFNLGEADGGALSGHGRVFAEAFNEEFRVFAEEGVVDGGSAEIDASDDFQERGSNGIEHIRTFTAVRAVSILESLTRLRFGLCESGDRNQLGPELLDGFGDHLDAEPGSLGDGEVAFRIEMESGLDDCIAEGAFCLIEFEGGRTGFKSWRQGRHGCHPLQDSGCADGSAPVVGNELQVIQPTERSDSACSGEADQFHFRLENVDEARLDVVANQLVGQECFPAGQRDAELAAEPGIASEVVCQQGFFPPEKVEFFQPAAEGDGLASGVGAIGIHGQPHVGTDGLAHGTDNANICFWRVADFHLQSPEALLLPGECFLAEAGREIGPVLAVHGGAIGAECGSVLLAEEA